MKAEQLDAIKCIYDGKDVFLWLLMGFGKSICYETLPFILDYKHSDGGTSGGCSIVLVVSPLVPVNTAATLQAEYLGWLFLRITTTCNLSIIGLVRGRFPESFAHAQTVDTRPLFPPPTWPGYEATSGQAILIQKKLEVNNYVCLDRLRGEESPTTIMFFSVLQTLQLPVLKQTYRVCTIASDNLRVSLPV